MSQELQLDEAFDWFNGRVSSQLSGYRNKALKEIRSITDKVEEFRSSAHRFDYSDIKDPDVYQNYATTIYDNIQEIFEEIEVPEIITYVNLEDFISNVKGKINSCTNMLAKYLSWLKRDRSYKDKVRHLDRSLSRLKEEVNHFESKTLVSYSEIIKYEKVLDDIESLREYVERNIALEEEINSHADDVERITKEIDKNQKELDELKNHPGFIQLEKNKKELEHIEITISNKVSEIKKLSNKVLRVAEKRRIEIKDYDRETMKNLVKDPLNAFIREAEGYPGIKDTLRYLKEISSDPAIQMKKEKLERAYENIDEILNDELIEQQKNAKFIIKQNEAIQDKFKEMQLDVKIKKYEREVDNLKIDRNRITLSLRREKDEVEEKINSTKKSIEERIEKYIGRKVILAL